VLVLDNERSGTYNVSEPNEYLSIEKAQRELGFDPNFRLNAGV
jgi:hypothetical protein